MDQDETWHTDRLGPGHTVRWGPTCPSPKRYSPSFSAHICCGQMAGWIKMPLGMEVGLGPGDFVLDGDQLALPKKGGGAPVPNFQPISIVAKWLDGSRWHLARRWALVHATLCCMGTQLPPQKRGRMIWGG